MSRNKVKPYPTSIFISQPYTSILTSRTKQNGKYQRNPALNPEKTQPKTEKMTNVVEK